MFFIYIDNKYLADDFVPNADFVFVRGILKDDNGNNIYVGF